MCVTYEFEQSLLLQVTFDGSSTMSGSNNDHIRSIRGAKRCNDKGRKTWFSKSILIIWKEYQWQRRIYTRREPDASTSGIVPIIDIGMVWLLLLLIPLSSLEWYQVVQLWIRKTSGFGIRMYGIEWWAWKCGRRTKKVAGRSNFQLFMHSDIIWYSHHRTRSF